jgi:sulfate adenylyltransferase subunit 2
MWKTEGLRQALDHLGIDMAFGDARPNDEKSLPVQQIFSARSARHR